MRNSWSTIIITGVLMLALVAIISGCKKKTEEAPAPTPAMQETAPVAPAPAPVVTEPPAPAEPPAGASSAGSAAPAAQPSAGTPQTPPPVTK